MALGNQRMEAEQSADPARRALAGDYHRQEIEQLERLQGAERRHGAAWDRFREADRRCATVLHQLVQDGLDDSRAYDALTGLSRGAGALGSAAGTISMLPLPPAKALTPVALVCDATQVGADAVVKVAYGDGGWGSVGISAATLGLDRTAGALKRGALATNPAASEATTRAARRLLRYDTGQRLRLGLAGERRAVVRGGATPGPHTFRATRRPGSLSATAHWTAEQVTGRAMVFARNKWLDDLALVTGDPSRSRTMFVASLGAGAAATGADKAGSVRDASVGRAADQAMRARDDADERGPGSDAHARPGDR